MSTSIRLSRQYIKTMEFGEAVGEDFVRQSFKDSIDDDLMPERISIVHTGPAVRGLAPVKAVITVSWEEFL